jgi:hypothetical protein
MKKEDDKIKQIPVDDSFERFQESELLSPVQSTFPHPVEPRANSPVTNIISRHYRPDDNFNDHVTDSEIGNLIKKAELGNQKLNLFFHGT